MLPFHQQTINFCQPLYYESNASAVQFCFVWTEGQVYGPGSPGIRIQALGFAGASATDDATSLTFLKCNKCFQSKIAGIAEIAGITVFKFEDALEFRGYLAPLALIEALYLISYASVAKFAWYLSDWRNQLTHVSLNSPFLTSIIRLIRKCVFERKTNWSRPSFKRIEKFSHIKLYVNNYK